MDDSNLNADVQLDDVPSPVVEQPSPVVLPEQPPLSDDEIEAAAVEQMTAARNRRARACLDEINELLRKHRCVIEPTIMLVGDKLTANVRVSPS